MASNKKLLVSHLQRLHKECVAQSTVYWNHYSNLSHYDSVISIPTLVISSITGLSSLSSFSSSQENEFTSALNKLTPILAIISTILASLNKYLRYGERAQKAKNQAKILTGIARRIQHDNLMLHNDMNLSKDLVARMTEDIYRELDIWGRDLDEVPKELRDLLNSISVPGEAVDSETSRNLSLVQNADEHLKRQESC